MRRCFMGMLYSPRSKDICVYILWVPPRISGLCTASTIDFRIKRSGVRHRPRHRPRSRPADRPFFVSPFIISENFITCVYTVPNTIFSDHGIPLPTKSETTSVSRINDQSLFSLQDRCPQSNNDGFGASGLGGIHAWFLRE
jgi:hypothetical protein